MAEVGQWFSNPVAAKTHCQNVLNANQTCACGKRHGQSRLTNLYDKGAAMQADPFGNLKDWGPVLEQMCQLAENGGLGDCQAGLTRILTYQNNWRLREEALNRIGEIQAPSDTLIRQVLHIVADDNLYYEVRILACECLVKLLGHASRHFDADLQSAIPQTAKNLLVLPQPPIFTDALTRLHSASGIQFGRY